MISGRSRFWYRLSAVLWLVFSAVSLFSQASAPDILKPHVEGRILVKFRPEVTKEKKKDIAESNGSVIRGEIPKTDVYVLELPAKASVSAFMHVFGSSTEVEFAEPDYYRSPDLVPNDPQFTSQWHLPKISAPEAWNNSLGSGVIIAILDTGVDSSHPDLIANMVPGWNVYDRNYDTNDVYGHGTAVAGSAAAASLNGIGVASVAGKASIMPVRISAPDGWASDSDIATGLTWAADHGARVANISYSVSGSATVGSAAQYFQKLGGVITVSAGNNSTFSSLSDNPYVLSVSASASNDALASFTNTGNYIDVAAPGSGIYTTSRGGGYGSRSGTSFSAPIVAGVAALVMSSRPDLTGPQVQEIIRNSADDLGPAGWDAGYGWGRINAARAVAMAQSYEASGDNAAPTVGITYPGAGATVSGTVTVNISAADDVGVAMVDLRIDGLLLGSDPASPYSFPWDTTGFSNGPHTLQATAYDAAGNQVASARSVTVDNVFDATAPTVTISSPSDGTTVPSGTVSIYSKAADNVGVKKVELYVNGSLTSTSSVAPYTNKWNSRKSKGSSFTLQLRAYDAAGNAGISPSIVVYK